MSEIKDKLQNDVKDAMRGKDKPRIEVLRYILAAIKQKEVDERIELTDADIIKIIDKIAKQHRESIDQFSQANRDDLVAKEKFELEIAQQYLPQALSESEIEQFIKEAMQETNANSIKDLGKVMAILKPKLVGRCDLSKVSEKIKPLLS